MENPITSANSPYSRPVITTGNKDNPEQGKISQTSQPQVQDITMSGQTRAIEQKTRQETPLGSRQVDLSSHSLNQSFIRVGDERHGIIEVRPGENKPKITFNKNNQEQKEVFKKFIRLVGENKKTQLWLNLLKEKLKFEKAAPEEVDELLQKLAADDKAISRKEFIDAVASATASFFHNKRMSVDLFFSDNLCSMLFKNENKDHYEQALQLFRPLQEFTGNEPAGTTPAGAKPPGAKPKERLSGTRRFVPLVNSLASAPLSLCSQESRQTGTVESQGAIHESRPQRIRRVEATEFIIEFVNQVADDTDTDHQLCRSLCELLGKKADSKKLEQIHKFSTDQKVEILKSSMDIYQMEWPKLKEHFLSEISIRNRQKTVPAAESLSALASQKLTLNLVEGDIEVLDDPQQPGDEMCSYIQVCSFVEANKERGIRSVIDMLSPGRQLSSQDELPFPSKPFAPFASENNLPALKLDNDMPLPFEQLHSQGRKQQLIHELLDVIKKSGWSVEEAVQYHEMLKNEKQEEVDIYGPSPEIPDVAAGNPEQVEKANNAVVE